MTTEIVKKKVNPFTFLGTTSKNLDVVYNYTLEYLEKSSSIFDGFDPEICKYYLEKTRKIVSESDPNFDINEFVSLIQKSTDTSQEKYMEGLPLFELLTLCTIPCFQPKKNIRDDHRPSCVDQENIIVIIKHVLDLGTSIMYEFEKIPSGIQYVLVAILKSVFGYDSTFNFPIVDHEKWNMDTKMWLPGIIKTLNEKFEKLLFYGCLVYAYCHFVFKNYYYKNKFVQYKNVYQNFDSEKNMPYYMQLEKISNDLKQNDTDKIVYKIILVACAVYSPNSYDRSMTSPMDLYDKRLNEMLKGISKIYDIYNKNKYVNIESYSGNTKLESLKSDRDKIEWFVSLIGTALGLLAVEHILKFL